MEQVKEISIDDSLPDLYKQPSSPISIANNTVIHSQATRQLLIDALND